MSISRADVIGGYRLFLDRDPENEAVITGNLSSSIREFVDKILLSDEFVNRNATLLVSAFGNWLQQSTDKST
jgi:hypothetical protein